MSIGLDKLKSIGVQKIHEATHISTKYIQDIFHENFEEMHQVQFLGFISILEREYNIDLRELRNSGFDYFGTKIKYTKDAEIYKTFSRKKKRNLRSVYVSIALVVFILFSFVSIRSLSSSYTESQLVDNSAIESAKNKIYIASNEANASNEVNRSNEQNSTVVAVENNQTILTNEQNKTALILDYNQTKLAKEQNQTVSTKDQNKTVKISEQKPSLTHSFKIIPKYKIWLGFVDLNTSKKSDKTFSDELVLDPNKDWALSFGHGFVDIELDGTVKKFAKKERLHLQYKNKELKEISFDEYKALGKGAL